MNNLGYAILFGAILLGNIVLPSLFNFEDNILTVLFLITFILYRGIRSSNLVWLMIFSLTVELMLGLNFGSLAISLLLLTVFIIFISRFMQIQPISVNFGIPIQQLLGLSIISSILYLILSAIYLIVGHVLYKVALNWREMPIIISPISMSGRLFISSFLLLLIFAGLNRIIIKKAENYD